MKASEIINRLQPPAAWADGEKIPWDDPEFSARMLKNHLSQDHDWASRRNELIDRHVDWIAEKLAPESRVLDLACGPGFYTERLSARGHRCLGVDFSPASIDYARQRAEELGLAAEYVLSDIRAYEPPAGEFDCVTFIFGEFNVFTEADARTILGLAARALKPGGLFVLEGHTFEAVKDYGLAPASWWTCQRDEGILSARPHICLQENYWDEEAATNTTRYFVIDGADSDIRMFCSSMTAYSVAKYEKMLLEAGFHTPRRLARKQWPVGPPFEGVMMTLTARR